MLGVHRICGVGGRTIFICYEARYNHVIKESGGFVYGGPIP